jgi:hypothetical protein
MIGGAISSAAEANWQFTSWGMTPDQVAIASHGASSYAFGNYTFKVDYSYDNGKLSTVSLTLSNPYGCGSLISDVSVKYGQPVGIDRPIPSITKIKWADQQGGNTVQVSKLDDACFLIYRPVQNGL